MTWKKQLKESTRSIDQLKRHIAMDKDEERVLREVVDAHPMCIPPYYMSLINPSDPDDPIRAMSVPCMDEQDITGSYDTSGEGKNTKMEGLQHKYSQTALLLATNQCAMYCRHCFRKRMVGIKETEQLKHYNEAAQYIEKHREINNVLITGGDPFVMSTSMIAELLDMISPIDHLDFIRFGTRIPVSLPQRIIEDPSLIALLNRHSRPERRVYVVTQFNHPNEITTEAIEAVDLLIGAGVLLSNQTVLLKGVNDDPQTLGRLQNNLVRIGIYPYYVFQCRPVRRVMHHFQVPLARGVQVVEEAKKYCNGHSKRFRYIMSHETGKIEIVGAKDNEIFFKYLHPINPMDPKGLFSKKLASTAGWLDAFDKK